MERIISDSLIFAGPTLEQVLSSPVHRAQQPSPADYIMLRKNLKGQDLNSATYLTASLQNTLGAARMSLCLTPLKHKWVPEWSREGGCEMVNVSAEFSGLS